MRNLRLQLVQVGAQSLIVALGMALVIGTEGIDLSVGSVMALAGGPIPLYARVRAHRRPADRLVAGVAVGLVNGVLVAIVGLQPIVATLGLFVAGRGLALVIADGRLDEIFDPTTSLDSAPSCVLRHSVCVYRGRVLRLVVAFVGRSTVVRQSGWSRSAATPTRRRAGRPAGQAHAAHPST